MTPTLYGIEGWQFVLTAGPAAEAGKPAAATGFAQCPCRQTTILIPGRSVIGRCTCVRTDAVRAELARLCVRPIDGAGQ